MVKRERRENAKEEDSHLSPPYIPEICLILFIEIISSFSLTVPSRKRQKQGSVVQSTLFRHD